MPKAGRIEKPPWMMYKCDLPIVAKTFLRPGQRIGAAAKSEEVP
jgi:hypothetical protein